MEVEGWKGRDRRDRRKGFKCQASREGGPCRIYSLSKLTLVSMAEKEELSRLLETTYIFCSS